MRRTLRPLLAAAVLAAVAVAPVTSVGSEVQGISTVLDGQRNGTHSWVAPVGEDVQSIGTMHADGSLVSGTRVTAVDLGTRVTAAQYVTDSN